MAIKSSRQRFKEKVNRNMATTKAKIVNQERFKSVKTLKNTKSIKYSSKIKKSDAKDIDKVRKSKISRRTQTLTGNIASNTKNVIRDSDDTEGTSTGVQSAIYFSDKIDTAADIYIGSKRIIHAVKSVRTIVNDGKSINGAKAENNSDIYVQAKGKVDKRHLLKQLSKKGTVNTVKSTFRVARNVKNQVSQSLSSEDTDLGIKSFANAEKEIRKTVDTVITVRDTSKEVVKVAKKVNNLNSKTNDYMKNKIYSERNKSYGHVADRIQKNKSNKIRTSQNIKTSKLNKSNNINIIHAKSQITRKFASEKVAATAKRAVATISNSFKAVIMLKNPVSLVAIGIIIILFMLNSASGSIASILSQKFFMADEDIALKYKEKVELLDDKLKEKISDEGNDSSYDDVRITYIGDNQGIYTNFQEIFALAAVKFEQDLTYSIKEEKFIEKIHSNLYNIKITTERYKDPDDEGGKKRKRKIITVYTYDIEYIMNSLGFNDEEKNWTRDLASNFSEQYPELATQSGELSHEELQKLIDNAPEFTSNQQKKLYNTALSIVGKVKYFWGGKSSAGWNNEWGVYTLVTSPGNDTTGTYRPFGLDCSGYVDWVYKTAEIGNVLSGGGTAYQWGKSYTISREDLKIGDLAFLQMPNSSGINHVGIYVGKDKDNNNLYAHSEWGTGATVNGFKGFKYFRRVVKFE